MAENVGRELGWDDEIEQDGQDFVTLPAGDYDFEVTNFERARHAGSAKLPPCNKAIVYIRIEGVEGATTIKHNLFLHSITEGMLGQFFVGIGQRQKGEKYSMNWNAVVGSTGRAKVGIHKFTGDDGEERVYNEIKTFYEPTDKPAGFEPGKF